MTSDQIGRAAESLAEAVLSYPVAGRWRRPFFRATSLGGKYPAADLLVDLLDPADHSLGFFFAQVKGTARPAGPDGRLPVGIDRGSFNRLAGLPAPTYLIGVDVGRRAAYLAPVLRPRAAGLATVGTAYNLDRDDVKIDLYREVLGHWAANRPTVPPTRFTDA